MDKDKQDLLKLQLETIADVVQSWIDWDKKRRDEEGIQTTPETHIMNPPYWPTHGTLTNWVQVLRGEPIERPIEHSDANVDDHPIAWTITHQNFCGLWAYRPKGRRRRYCATVLVDGQITETGMHEDYLDAALEARQLLLGEEKDATTT